MTTSETLLTAAELAAIGERWQRGKAAVDAGKQPNPVDTALIIVRVPALLAHVAALEAELSAVRDLARAHVDAAHAAADDLRKLAEETDSSAAHDGAGLLTLLACALEHHRAVG